VRYRPLGKTGLQVSIIGFGASPLGNEFGSIDARTGERAVHLALDRGINLFDVAPYYGRTLAEQRLGEALKGRRAEAVLATKCGRYDVDQFDFSASSITQSLENSLRRLQTDHVDVLTAHDIEFGSREQIVNETIPAMRDLQRAGKVCHVGISGLQLRMLADVAVRADVDTVLSYCRYNLLVDDMESWLLPVAKAHQIGLINASPLHMRLLTFEGAPAWHPAPDSVKRAAAQVVSRCAARGVDPALVALRFCLDQPDVSATLVGMSEPREVERNLLALEAPVEPDLFAEIAKLVEPVKNTTWRSGLPENHDG
jgi:L-galactose dehydrogenase